MSFSKKVNLYEVGPRDGLQNEKNIIPTKIKLKFIRKLIDCNFKHIEIGSPISPPSRAGKGGDIGNPT